MLYLDEIELVKDIYMYYEALSISNFLRAKFIKGLIIRKSNVLVNIDKFDRMKVYN